MGIIRMAKKLKTATSPLIDRQQTEIVLKTSYSTVRRMEADGTLTPVRLRKRGKVHYRKAQVYRLIGEPVPE